MKLRPWAAAVVFALIWVVGPAHPSTAATATVTASSTQCSTADYAGDPRLGPAQLPTAGLVGLQLTRYDRFAGLAPRQFLSIYWDPAANNGQGSWRYPPANGFLLGPNGQPIEQILPLRPGQRIDRYGSEFGSFLAPAGTPYSYRSIPPQSLDNQAVPAACNYHLYRVIREFRVNGGPIAPAFGQPGKGVQYLLVSSLVPECAAQINILCLIANGYLQRLI
jgi:Tuberculosis necrotizing toxin